MKNTFDYLKTEYAELWRSMVIRPDRSAAVTTIAKRLIADKGRYLRIEQLTGVPWFVVAALHDRESDADFNTYLGNGQSLHRKTTIGPIGRGPFKTFDEGAVDALRHDGLDQVDEWSPERACYEVEKFNGFGYRNEHPNVKSPYLWSFSQHYTRGKYVGDHDFNANTVDQDCGAMVIIKRIMELDATAKFAGEKSLTAPAVITTAGGILGSIAHTLGAAPAFTIAIVIAAVLAAILVYELSHRR